MYEGHSPLLESVTIKSAHNAILEDYASRPVTETFTRSFENIRGIHYLLLEEMRGLFRDLDGRFSARECEQVNEGIHHFLQFVSTHGDDGLQSIQQLTSQDASMFFDFLQTKEYWKNGYRSLRPRLKEKISVEFPDIPRENKITEGLSVSACAALREALCKEIDRIREKIGRLDADLASGKVLEILSIEDRCLSIEDQVKLERATRADIIKTICHHVPGFPFERGATIKKTEGKPRKNVGEWLLKEIKKCAGESQTTNTSVRKIIKKMFRGSTSLYQYYYPTQYDAACIIMYWALVTGWNRGAIESVGRDELNLGLKRNKYQGILNNNYIVLRGIKPRRSQGKTKYVTHISDLNDEYGLYNVVKDFYSFTGTIRHLVDSKKARCIFLTVPEKGNVPMCFGPGSKSSDFARLSAGELNRTRKRKTQIQPAEKFLAKHEIFDSPSVRVKTVTWRILRTSYETVLEDMDLPLYVRQKLMGHVSMDTTMLFYGSDSKSYKLQFEKLGKILTDIHGELAGAKFFQGAILPPERDPRRQQSGKVEYHIFTDWQNNYIMLCESATTPTWTGHELYVKPGKKCTFIAKCLLCKSCLIDKNTLPHLASWDMDITDYFEDDDGAWDKDTQWLILQKAIREAFEIWCHEVDPEDVKWAKAQAKKSDFPRIGLDIWHIGGLCDDDR